MLEVRSPGCATCGDTNVRYQYDAFARLTETIKLDQAGQPLRALRTEFDALGRPSRISQLMYAGGKLQPGGASMRYLYRDAGLPHQVTRPSVVPGKEMITSISYNAAGQPLEVSESGWAPGSGGEAVAITRSTRYGYRQINGRSLLASIDGPLPNGPSASPSDSDITLLEWDKGGNAVVAVTGAGNVRSTLAYDALWRVAAVTNGSGASTRFRYDIGFSRGAAQAREFANRIAARTTPDGWYQYTVPGPDGGANVTRCQKVNFRFLGLWDTVLSTNNGPAYNLGIPEQFAHVAHAVALNEFRGQTGRWVSGSWLGAFPLEPVEGGPATEGKVRIERGFLGSHSDIGGGYGATENQLAQVALEWMIKQAVTAGVAIDDAPRTIIANPIVHDKSNNQNQLNGRPTGEDRDVHYRDGRVVKQRQMVLPGLKFSDTEQFITYRPSVEDENGNLVRTTVPGAGTGTVDMAGYLAWLRNNGYDLNLTVQGQ